MFDLATSAYFPEVGLLSIITVMASGEAIETSIVGREGGVGFIETLGGGIMTSRVITQIPGRAFRVQGRHYREALDGSASMRAAVQRHTELLLDESGQAIACRDPQRGSAIQSLDARMPGSFRWRGCPATETGVSGDHAGRHPPDGDRRGHRVAAKGLIRYTRGSITVLDRQGLARGACECRACLQRLGHDLTVWRALRALGRSRRRSAHRSSCRNVRYLTVVNQYM